MNRRLSLRTELLLNIALLVATALLLAVASVVLLYDVLDPAYAPIYISILVAADVFVLVAYVAYQVNKIILKPLREAMATAEAIAGGDLARRLVPGETREMENLATSVNLMTDRLLEDRAHLIRVEKMASVGRLAAGVAHEIGNPLGAMNGYLHILRRSAPESREAQDALAGLERESARIDRIVKGLLDYARPRPRTSGEVDVNDTARAVIDLLATQGALKPVTLDVRLADDPTTVSGDRHELEQVFVNILLNAVDAMSGSGRVSVIVRRVPRSELLAGAGRASDGGTQQTHPPSPRARRWLETTDAESIVMVAITDSGPGIPIEDSDRVFEPFYTTKEPGKGTGLGLAIVARAIDNAGGTIWVSPSREGGAAFRILLPAARVTTRPSGGARLSSPKRVALS